jgi:hypothetical protein
MGFGCFVSPDGEVVGLLNDRHIATVADDPERFGLTRKWLAKVYARHGETPGVEGWARLDVLPAVVRRGWIRVRHYETKGAETWTIQVPALTREVRVRLAAFARRALRGGPPFPSRVSRWDEVALKDSRGAELGRTTFGEMARDVR